MEVAVAANVLRLCVRLRSVGIVRSGSLHTTAVSGCFFSLIIRTLENILKISLKKFADSKKALYICIVKQLKPAIVTGKLKKSNNQTTTMWLIVWADQQAFTL